MMGDEGRKWDKPGGHSIGESIVSKNKRRREKMPAVSLPFPWKLSISGAASPTSVELLSSTTRSPRFATGQFQLFEESWI